MAIADNKALLNDIMDIVDDYVTALVSAVMGNRDCSTVTELYLFFVKEEEE